MYCVSHNYFRPGQLISKTIFFVFRTFNPLHPNISMYILLTVI